MRVVFADTFYFLALLNHRDRDHARVVAWTRSFGGRLVTTDRVLTELANSIASSGNRTAFVRTRTKLQSDGNYQVVPCSVELFEEGIRLYDARPDKQWSLTDCISFVVMQREGITKALTGDHHFEQAGFTILLKP